jgi:hypothetical protein
MGLTGNFGALSLDRHGLLTVTGSSTGLAGYELVSRDVAVHQKDLITHSAAKNVGGSTGGSAKNPEPTPWATDPPLAAAEFQAGVEAVALGFETYFTGENGHLPTYMTFTWSQIVTIT